jgi:hypothetical protein
LCYNLIVKGATYGNHEKILMELVVSILKYIFVGGLVVEIALILRALFSLARDRAGEAAQPSGLSGIEGAAPAEE